MAKLINLKSFKQFFESGSVGGSLLIGCVILSLAIANSRLGPSLESLLSTTVGISFTSFNLRYPVLLWINDGLMAIFFLLVGLEIKRELVDGELSSFKKASLPILAALGGVLAPALLFTLFNRGTPTEAGWGIPMATDIAFALAIVSLLGRRVPASLKIFLAALAIVDDLMAILVIAIFYSTELHYSYLVYAGSVFGLLLLFNRFGVKHLVFYLVPGLFIWYFIHHSGIHATIAGVLTAFAIPSRHHAGPSPIERLEHSLIKPVNFLIMPVFALANTNIVFEERMIEGVTTPLGLGIIVGLLLGKPVGITLFSWMAVKSGFSKLPKAANWKHIFGAGILGGIGFTMSIFIALLSFPGEHLLLAEAKFSILSGSILSGTMGYTWLASLNKR
jgi:NhaA family Na+:H+ antiporter